jgi:hypothetical protein
MPGKAAVRCADVGSAPRASTVVRGRWSLGAAGPSPRLCAAGPARTARRQVRAPGQVRTGNPPQRTRELASARMASGHEHQGDEPKPRLDPTEFKSRHLRGSGRRTLPEPPPGIVDVSRNPSRALRVAARSLRDGLRPPLTEPVRRACSLRAATNGPHRSRTELRRCDQPATNRSRRGDMPQLEVTFSLVVTWSR